MPLRGEAEAKTYIDLREVHQGSNQLFRCSHVLLGSDCVQKTVPILNGSVVSTEPRLLEELEHPHITPVREAQFDPVRQGCITFVMPWYAGGSIADALVEGHRFSIHQGLAIARDLLDALAYLHTVRRYLHRDVKTSNVLLDDVRSAGFLGDFERAAQMDSSGRAQAMLTTAFYLAPECGGTGECRAESDLYGAGMILFELLNGRFKWESFDRAEAEARLMRGLRPIAERHISPGAFAPHLPSDLVRLVRKALSRDPDARFRSAGEFLRALNAIKAIDWRVEESADPCRVWIGSWPPAARSEGRDRYRITGRVMAGGQDRGRLRLVAELQRPATTTWRRCGVGDLTVDGQDNEAIRQFFKAVAVSAAHRRPAR